MPLLLNFTTIEDKPWEKLSPENFKQNEIFTTFRGYTPKLDKFYNKHIGDIFHVRLDGEDIGKAQLKEIQYFWSNKLPIHIIKQDTFNYYTYNHWRHLMKNFYDKEKVYGFLLTFEIEEVENNYE